MFFKRNERSEYSFIGLADLFFVFFFAVNGLEICSRSILIFRVLTCDYFVNSVHFFS